MRLMEEMQFCEDFSRKLIMDMAEIMGEHDVDISEKSFSRDIAVVLEFVKSLTKNSLKLLFVWSYERPITIFFHFLAAPILLKTNTPPI